jgi:glutamyl-tRNA synthetase
MPAVRMILTGATSGPDLMEIIEVLGKEEVLARLVNGLKKVEETVS